MLRCKREIRGPFINECIEEKVYKYYKKYYSSITPKWRELIYDILTEEKMTNRLFLISEHINCDLKNKKMLEIGSGFGLFVVMAQKSGIDCYGVEPEPIAYTTSVELVKNYGGKQAIFQATGEELPYSEGVFDLVVSFQTLEHTQNPKKCLKESIRVLKEGGYLYFVIPNYNSIWEGHYGVFWLPQLPKLLAKLYVRLLGRNPDFLNDIQYITPNYIRRILQSQNVDILSMGIEIWEKRMDDNIWSAWGQTGKMKSLVKLVHSLKITFIVKYFGKRFGFYYPIILIVRKRSRAE